MTRKGGDACHADMLSGLDLNTIKGQCNGAKLCNSSGGPAGAFLTAISGGRMTLVNDDDEPVRCVCLAPPGERRSC